MKDILKEFEYRKSLLSDLNYREAKSRISGFLTWLESEEITNSIIQSLKSSVDVGIIMLSTGTDEPPDASTPEEIASVGIFFMEECRKGKDIGELGFMHGVEPPFSSSSLQDTTNEVIRRYIGPATAYIESQLIEREGKNVPLDIYMRGRSEEPPLEITESLKNFFRVNPDIRVNAFIVMKFGKTKAHGAIYEAVRSTLERYGIRALRADEREFHEDLFFNVLTYIYGCRFGIAIFERLEEEDFNPNVSLEVGYMKALHKHVCLLKDKTLKTLQSDLVGKLYRSFDPQDPGSTIPGELEGWLRDKDIITL